jgi:hypothetical protein
MNTVFMLVLDLVRHPMEVYSKTGMYRVDIAAALLCI